MAHADADCDSEVGLGRLKFYQAPGRASRDQDFGGFGVWVWHLWFWGLGSARWGGGGGGGGLFLLLLVGVGGGGGEGGDNVLCLKIRYDEALRQEVVENH